MKTKILLLTLALTAASFVHAQSPMMFMVNGKRPPLHTQIIKRQIPASVTSENQSANYSSPITIDYTNNLVPPAANDDNIFIFDQQIPVPSLGGNQIYDFGNLTYESENFSTNTLVRPPRPHVSGDI